MPAGAPTSRGIEAFAGLPALPRRIALDTSLVLEALIESETHHVECAAFLERLADEQVEVCVSELLLIELAHASVRVARRQGLNPRGLVEDVLGRWNLTTSALSMLEVPVGLVSDVAVQYVMDYGVLSYDAVHAASAVLLAAAMAALDGDFARLPQGILTILTVRDRVDELRLART